MKIGDKVTYLKCRDTQDVQPERRFATGIVREIDVSDGTAKVEWEWASGVGFWVHTGLLEVTGTDNT